MMNTEFNNWWDNDLLTENNPFVDGTPAFWAWEGWCAKAALAEQPAQHIPDLIHHTDLSETLEYITGWNDCRQAILAEQPAQQALDKMAENARELGLDYEPEQEPVAAAKKDAVFSASIEFIGTLTGMNPPPIEVAPPEILKPFKDFTEKVCSIFAAPQPEQEPVAWMCADESLINKGYARFSHVCMGDWKIPVYTTPPQRKPLTDEEIYDMYNEPRSDAEMIAFARAIEAAHGIKGEA